MCTFAAAISKGILMLRIVILLLISIVSVSGAIFCQPEVTEELSDVKVSDHCMDLYKEMKLDGKVNYAAFRQAVIGYTRIEKRKREVLTLIDFTKPSTQERLYVFDMKGKKMLISSVVAHGKNSGNKYATSFSNEEG